MRVEPNRPYFNKSIAQLEALLEVPGLDINVLRALEYELTQRKKARASKLHAKVLQVLETQQATQSGTPAGNTIVQAARLQSVPSASSGVTKLRNDGIPPIEDLGVLPVAKMPKGRNEPTGVIAAWTALEALSPQTYRRPEDMAAGDRRCVAHLREARLPWNAGERSRPNRRLYYQVILGAVSMGRATEELVQTFGVDEEQDLRPVQEKAAIAAILIDKNGIVVEENGIGVSSFAWALPLALKRIGWHSFRRTLATLLHSQGASVKTTQDLMRHSSPIMTLGIYAKAVTEEKRHAQDTIAALFLQRDENQAATA